MSFEAFVKNYDVVVWDWNGTLLNDLISTHKVIKSILIEEGLEPISVEEYKKHFGFPIANYYASIGLPGFGEGFDRVAHKFIQGYQAVIKEIALFEDTIELLDTVKKLNLSQYVLSAAKSDHLRDQLNSFNISHYFNDISGANDFYAHGKIDQAKAMKTYFDSKGYEKGVYIGDTDHDYEVSQVLGFDFCFSAQGHQNIDKLDESSISYILRA